MPLTAIIHTKNAATTVRAALESVKFADEIVVVDMESTDGTPLIARDYTKHIFSHEDVGYADPARNFGLSKASQPWILVLDADEEVPVSLKELIQAIVSGTVGAELQADAYYLPRRNEIFNTLIKHSGWWPDYQLRLFKKGTVTWQDGVHRLPDATGTSVYLPASDANALLHHNYQSVTQFIDRLNRYTSIKANETKDTDPQVTESTLLTLFSGEFFSRYFAHQGYKDGAHGMALSLLQSMYQVTVQLKQWDNQHFPAHHQNLQNVDKGLRKFQKELNYWLADAQVQNTSGLKKIYWQIRRKWCL